MYTASEDITKNGNLSVTDSCHMAQEEKFSVQYYNFCISLCLFEKVL